MFKRPVGLIVGLAMIGVSLLGLSGRSALAGDTYFCAGEPATIVALNPVTNGTSKRDVIYVPAGEPVTVHAKGGNDLICSDNDYATVHGDSGDDSLYGLGALYGDSGNDYLSFYTDQSGLSQDESALSVLSGGSGNDTIDAQNVAFVDGGSGNDTIYAYDVGEIHAGSGNDFISAESIGEVYADAGNDLVFLYSSYLLDCGSGRDSFNVDIVDTVQRCENTDLIN